MIKRYRRILETVVLVLTGGFIIRTLFDGWTVIAGQLTAVQWPLLLLSWLSFLLYFFLRANAWSYLMEALGQPLPTLTANRIWFLSEFTRYLPGNVWSFASRTYLAHQQGASKAVALISLILEVGLLVGSAILYAGLFFILSPYNMPEAMRWLFILAIPILFFLLSPRLLELGLNRLLRLAKRQPISIALTGRQLGVAGLLLASAWLAYGAASLLVMLAFTQNIDVSPLWTITAFIVAWLVGYLSFLTPMGLGVREGVIIALLAPVMPAATASLIALSSRLWLILSELSVLVIIGLTTAQQQRHKLANQLKIWWQQYRPEAIVGLGILLFIGYFTFFTFTKHANFHTARFDLGIMDQTVWNTAQGRWLELTNPVGTETIIRFAIHSDFFLALMAPLYWVAPSPYTLLFVQVVVVALGAIALYRLGTEVLKHRGLAATISLAYLLFPPIERAVIFDFHSVTLVSTFLLFAFYFLYKRQYWLFALFTLLTLSTKETMSFLVIMLGLYAIIAQRNWKVGLTTIAIGGLWFYLLLWHIMPGARTGIDGNTHFALGYYAKYGDTPGAILKTLILKPLAWLPDVFTLGQLRYLSWFFIPTGLLALFSPVILLAVPEFAINMLSDNLPMRTFYYQYSSALTPLVFIALVFGAARIRPLLTRLGRYFKISVLAKQADTVLILYLLVMTVFTVWRWSPLPGTRMADVAGYTPYLPGKEFIQELKQTMPTEASVSATVKLSPHFSHRQHIYSFPLGIGQADYILISQDAESEVTPDEDVDRAIADLKKDTRYQSIYDNGVVSVYQRITTQP